MKPLSIPSYMEISLQLGPHIWHKWHKRGTWQPWFLGANWTNMENQPLVLMNMNAIILILLPQTWTFAIHSIPFKHPWCSDLLTLLNRLWMLLAQIFPKKQETSLVKDLERIMLLIFIWWTTISGGRLIPVKHHLLWGCQVSLVTLTWNHLDRLSRQDTTQFGKFKLWKSCHQRI